MANQKGLISYLVFTLMVEIFDTTVYILTCCICMCVYIWAVGLWPEGMSYYYIIIIYRRLTVLWAE